MLRLKRLSTRSIPRMQMKGPRPGKMRGARFDGKLSRSKRNGSMLRANSPTVECSLNKHTTHATLDTHTTAKIPAEPARRSGVSDGPSLGQAQSAGLRVAAQVPPCVLEVRLAQRARASSGWARYRSLALADGSPASPASMGRR